MKPQSLAAIDLPRIASRALTDERAVLRAYAGGKVRNLTRLRVEKAASELGLPHPPQPAIATKGL
jgi:hypothetical protein